MGKGFDRFAALRATDVFGNLADSVLYSAMEYSILRNLKRGDVLFSESEQASALYVVGSGELRSSRLSVDGREQVLSTEGPGAVLAMVAIFGGGRLASTVIAETSSEVLAIAKPDALALCRGNAELLWNVVQVLTVQVRQCVELIENLALRHVDQRVAQYLFTVCKQRGLEDSATCIFEITMNRAEIATRLGSTREVVSRAFAQLQKSGLIELHGSRLVTIPDIQALRAYAGSDGPS